MTEKQRKLLWTTLKFVVSIALLYFIFTKIEFGDVTQVVKTAGPSWMVVALALFIGSKILNSLRLNRYFKSIGVHITESSNLKLYGLGMFYNLFLPGGIGGDAYKGYAIHNRYGTATKKLIAVLLLDRLNGMLLIFIFACLLGLGIDAPFFSTVRPFRVVAIPISVGVFWWVSKRFFPYTLDVFWGTLGYSAVLQALQLLTTLCIMYALGIETGFTIYLLVFLVSSIVSVIPLTIGGVGSRELTFLYGAEWLGLDANAAIGISFVFFLLTALVSLAGGYFHFKKPVLKTTKT